MTLASQQAEIAPQRTEHIAARGDRVRLCKFGLAVAAAAAHIQDKEVSTDPR